MTFTFPIGRRTLHGNGPGLALALGLLAGTAGPAPALADDPAPAAPLGGDAEAVAFRDQVVPLLQRYCVGCHGGEKVKGGVNLTRYADVDAVRRDRKAWEKVLENVDSGAMPPEGSDAPTPEELQRLTNWIEAVVSKADCDLAEPGRVTMRRLNRAEYNNTVRDLLGVDFRPADDFPLDDVGYGFDNIGDVLTLPPLLMEKYLNAAEQITARAIVTPVVVQAPTRTWPGKDLQGGEPYGDRGAKALYSNGTLGAEQDFPRDGQFRVRVQAFGHQGGGQPVKMGLLVDGKPIRSFDVKAIEGEPGTYEAEIKVAQGRHSLGLAFLNDFFDAKQKDESRRDRNLIVQSLEVVPPATAPLWRLGRFGVKDFRGGQRQGDVRTLASTDGEVTAKLDLPSEERALVIIRAHGDQAGPEPVKMAVRIDGKEVTQVDVPASAAEPGRYEVTLDLPAGSHEIGLALLNDYYQPDAPDPKDRGDRNLHVGGLEVYGPKPGALPESHTQLITKTPRNYSQWRDTAREILHPFLERAYRRTVRAEEVDKLIGLVELVRADGESFERGIQLAVTAALINPHFLYRVEVDRRDFEGKPSGPARKLNDFELASRLSYFLWSSMPDAELLKLARDKKLNDDAVLEAQVRRMLAHKKATALVENFADQWLTLRNLKNVNPDPNKFRDFSTKLRDDMQRETELCFEAILKDDRSILELLDADYTFLNERLAKHYGVEGIKGNHFRKVDLPADSPRGGILTQASVLTVTSNPGRTSPVKRGKWILEQVLGTPPPPPPPDVPELKEGAELKGTLRQRMEQHRSNPSCATCHSKMDPLGFGFENFDAVGRWRTEDGGDPIDPSGELPSGEKFAGVDELKTMLLTTRSEQFTRNLSEKLLTYALGRGLEYYDACAADTIAAQVAADGHKFSRLVVEIVRSEPFRKRTRDLPLQAANGGKP